MARATSSAPSSRSAALTVPYLGRTTASWVDFLEQVDTWLPAEAAPVYAIVDNLSTHSAPDVLLFSLAHPAGSSSSSRPMPPT